MNPQKRLIFTVTTGRSGTRHLAFCLGLFRDVDSQHEPEPKFSDVFRAALSSPERARRFWIEDRLPRIARTTRPIYAETSHLIAKGFLESLFELGHVPTLLHLVRAPRAVATSLWRLGTIPGRTRRGLKYYLGPGDPGVLAWAPPDGCEPHDYQLCYWYCLEMERRAATLARELQLRGGNFVRVELDSLLTFAGVRALGRELELGALRVGARISFRVFGPGNRNAKRRKKAPCALSDAALQELEAEVQRWSDAAPASAPEPRTRNNPRLPTP